MTVSELKKILETVNPDSEVIEMGLCEVPHIGLRPDQLYRFVVMPDCQKCEDAAAPYQTNVSRQRPLAGKESHE
jgi:hypothetical protein